MLIRIKYIIICFALYFAAQEVTGATITPQKKNQSVALNAGLKYGYKAERFKDSTRGRSKEDY
jgi:hypothetical protein